MSVQNVPSISLNDGNSMPALGLGIFGTNDDDSQSVVTQAIQVGYRLLDTAALYGNEVGVGRAIRSAEVERKDLFIITKLHEDVDSYDGAIMGFDESLQKLDLEYIDLYLIHWPQPRVNKYVEIWKAFEAIKASGRVRSIGVSNFTARQLARLKSETDILPVVNQIELHPTFQQQTMRDTNASQHIITQAWSPLGGQRQFKKLLEIHKVPDDENPVLIGLGAKHNLTPTEMRRYLEALPVDTIFGNESLTAIAKKHGKSVAQIVLRWHVEIGSVPLPKTENFARLKENLDVFDFALDGEDRLAIAAIETGVRTGFDPDLFN